MPDGVDGTQILPKFDDSLAEYVKKKLWEKIRKGAKPWSQWYNSDVYWFGDNSTGFICLVHEDDILYFVRYKLIKANKMNFGRQILVWRDPTKKRSESAGFVQNIFFNVLLPKFRALIADQEQTEKRQRFGAVLWPMPLIITINISAIS